MSTHSVLPHKNIEIAIYVNEICVFDLLNNNDILVFFIYN